jgi:hypothetical protein
MRTTVTLEPDVARRLHEVVRQEKMSFKEALNVTLRRGLDQTLTKPRPKPFRTVAENMGVLPHLNYDNIGDLLELAEKTSPT